MRDSTRHEAAVEAIARAVYKAWPARVIAKTAPGWADVILVALRTDPPGRDAVVAALLDEPSLAAPFPSEGMALTVLLVVADLQRSVAFYRDVLGASLYREYGETTAVFSFVGTWILLVTGGGPTKDKPDVTFAPPADPGLVDHEFTIRVPDCQAAYDALRGRGAEFLTPPVDWGGEIRAFFRDPDGHLIEISEVPASGR